MTPEERWELIEGWILKHEERHEQLEAAQAEQQKAQAEQEKARAEQEKQHKRDMDELRGYLRHAVRLNIREARNERAKRREMMAEFDDKITKIAAAHLENEEGLKELQASMQALQASMRAFLDSLRRGGNGHQSTL